MKTLFIISLPRSLSSLVFEVARLSLDLIEPSWTSHGEIMNNDRYIHYTGKSYDESLKYIRQEKENLAEEITKGALQSVHFRVNPAISKH